MMHNTDARQSRLVAANKALPPRRGALRFEGDPLMTNVFAVVGERCDDPNHLLVLGEDGSYYDYALSTGHAAPTEPDESWTADPSAQEIGDEMG
jgi:hypothetical protein